MKSLVKAKNGVRPPIKNGRFCYCATSLSFDELAHSEFDDILIFMDKVLKWIALCLMILFFVLFPNPETRMFAYLILIPCSIGVGIALISYVIVLIFRKK